MPKAPLKYKIIMDTREFFRLSNDWNRLFCRAKIESLHMTWPFVENWVKIYGNRYNIRVIVFFKDNEVIGIIPFMRKKLSSKLGLPYTELRFLCDDDQVSFDYLTFLILDDYRESVLKYLRSILSKMRFDIIRLRNTKYQIPFGTKDGFVSEKINSCFYNYLPNSWDVYFLSKNRKFRYNIRARLRNAKKLYEVKYVICDRDISLERGFEKLLELNRLRWGSKGEAFRTEEYNQFHWEIMKRMLVEKRLFLRFLSMNNELVSANYCISSNNVLYFLQMGRNPAFDKFGVGNLLIAEIIKEAISKGITKIDFLATESPYKKKWADESYDLYQISKSCSLRGKMVILQNLVSNSKWFRKFYGIYRSITV